MIMKYLSILLALFASLTAFGQSKTWTGNSTSLWPNVAPNSVVFSQNGSGTLTILNPTVSGSRMRFASPVGAGTTNDIILTRTTDGNGDIRPSTYTIGDLLSIGAGGQNFANTDLTFTGSRIHDANGNTFTLNDFTSFTLDGSTIDLKGTGTSQFKIDATGVTIQSDVSTKLFLRTPGVVAGSSTVGQYVQLINATTGESEFANGPTPGASGVDQVATAATDLAGATANVVVTRGYTTAGDGGGGIYRAETGSAATVDGVRVFTRTAGGRYILQETSFITAKQAGASGNGSTDDRARLQALFNACTGLTAHLDPLSYRSIGGLTIPAGVKVYARGATLTCETTGLSRAVTPESNGEWDGGTVICSRQSGGASGNDHNCFGLGDYLNGHSISNYVIRNVTLSVLNYATSAIFISGASYNIVVENIIYGDSADLDDVVTVHWGYVSPPETNGTLHPHDIQIRNIKAGRLTTTTADGSPVFISAAYNITVDGFQAEEARHGVCVVAGDFGFKYSGFAAQTLGSVVIRNGTVLKTKNLGVLVQNLGVSAQVYPQEFVFESLTMFGSNDGTGNGGAYLNTTRNTTFRNCVFAGHTQGTVFTGGCDTALFDSCTFTTNSFAGIDVSDTNTKNISFVGCKSFKNGRGTSGINAAGAKLAAGSLVTIERCVFGDQTSETTQEVGVQVVAPFQLATLIGNHVANVKSGGVNQAFYLGGSSDLGQLNAVNRNTCLSSITLYANGGASVFLPGAFPNCIQVLGNADFTYLPHQHCRQLLNTTTITAGRAITLSTTGAVAGETVTYTRTDAGGFNVTFSGKSIPANSWATSIYNGSSWVLKQYGAL